MFYRLFCNTASSLVNSEFGEAYLCMNMETGLKLGYGGSAMKSENYFALLRMWELFTLSCQSQAEMDGDGQHIPSSLHDFCIVPLSPVSTEQKIPFGISATKAFLLLVPF